MKNIGWFSWLTAGLIMAVSFFLMLSTSFQESAIMDELAHIPAGYGYVRFLDYRLNPEHPPLIKALSALPLLFYDSFGAAQGKPFGAAQGKLNFPTDKSPWQSDVNGQWAAGAQFLYESGNDADKIIQTARFFPILVTLLTIFLIYVWSREVLGKWWALTPTLLFALSPTVLSHGHYVTTDLGATFGVILSIYYLWKYLEYPSKKNLVFTGLSFGIAQLAKFSNVLLIPFFIFIIVAFYIWKALRGGRWSYNLFRSFFNIILIFLIGYALVYAVYSVFTFNYPVEKQKTDTEFILNSFAGGPDPSWSTCKINSEVQLSRRVRCLANINIWMTENKIVRPLGEYLLGVLMVLQRSAGGNTGYFLGEVSAAGWWYYFPVIFVLKEPIPSLIIIFLGMTLGIWRLIKAFKTHSSKFKTFLDYLGTNFQEFSMLVFILLYWLYSIKSPLNIGVRHILPTMPFVYILSTGALKKWLTRKKAGFKTVAVAILLAWFILETAFAYPYFLSYFNELGGGVRGGYKYAVDSNYDWGQDLKRLKEFTDKNRIQKIAVDYFGGGNVRYYLGDPEGSRRGGTYGEYWQSSKGNPKDYGIDWLAVSVNTLQGAFGKLHLGQPRNPEDEYLWLKAARDPYKPDARAGTSIFIYKL